MDNLKGLLGIRRMVRVMKAQIKFYGVTKGQMNGLMVFSGGSAMWRGWRLRESMWENVLVVANSVLFFIPYERISYPY